MSRIKQKQLKFLLSVISSFVFVISQLPVFAQEINSNLQEQNLEDTKDREKVEESKEEVTNSEKEKVLKGYVSKVPSGTKLKIIVETPIDEITSMVDDEFTARTSENVAVDGKVVVPAGSTVIGKISEVNPAKRLHKSGSVRIEFENLTTSDGRHVPIVASVLSRSGLLKGKLTKKNALISGATIITPIAAGTGAGLIAGNGSALGPVVGAALGAIAGIALFAFQKGNMVDIKAGDDLNIELTEEALVPLDLPQEEAQETKEEKFESDETDQIKDEPDKVNVEEKDFSEEVKEKL